MKAMSNVRRSLQEHSEEEFEKLQARARLKPKPNP
jgi:hypothetical protein